MPSPRDIALDMARAEEDGDVQTLERYLHDDMIVRRAGGSVANKPDFLKTVKKRDHVSSEMLMTLPVGLGSIKPVCTNEPKCSER